MTTHQYQNPDINPEVERIALQAVKHVLHARHCLARLRKPSSFTPLVTQWLAPPSPHGESSAPSQVEDALLLAKHLGYPDRLALVHHILHWVYSPDYGMQALYFIAQLDFEIMQKVVVPYVRDKLASITAPSYSDYWQAAFIFYYLGFIREGASIAEEALTHTDPEIQQAGHDILKQLAKDNPPPHGTFHPETTHTTTETNNKDTPSTTNNELPKDSLQNEADIPPEVEHAALQAVDLLHQAEECLAQLESLSDLVPVLTEWLLPPRQRANPDSPYNEADALPLAGFLPNADILTLAPLMLFWTYSQAFGMQYLQLVAQLPFKEIRKVAAPCIHNELASTRSPDYWDYWDAARVLYYLGLVDDARSITAQALSHTDPEIQEAGRDLIEFFDENYPTPHTSKEGGG